MAEIALETLWAHFEPDAPRVAATDAGNLDAPLFVTWTRGGALRGCIGTFARGGRGVREFALISALEDSRFEPVTREEFPLLTCTVTFLKDFVNITERPMEWEIGVHGIELELLDLGLSATFLPSVAQEQGWSKEETFHQLIRKAGARGKLDDFDVRVTRYTGVKSVMDAKDYLASVASKSSHASQGTS